MKVYLCEICGNLIRKEKEETSICCSKPMLELKPNTTDAAEEKHVPVITQDENHVTVTIGETLHPMTEEHYIKWIYLETNKGIKKRALHPADEPKATFELEEDEKIINAYAYCNLHSLWVKEL